VLTSVLLQGTSLAQVARWLRVDAPPVARRLYPIEYTPMRSLQSELKELPVAAHSSMAGQAIVDLGLPPNFLIVLIARANEFILPSGSTILQSADTLLVLADEASFQAGEARFSPAT
jgi:potassium/hydrogen antiporter